jgi:hypothetical protein
VSMLLFHLYKMYPFTELCIYPSFFLCNLFLTKVCSESGFLGKTGKNFTPRRLPVPLENSNSLPLYSYQACGNLTFLFPGMDSLVYVELLNNPRHRKFLNRAFPLIRHVGIKHFFMTPFIAALKDDCSGIVNFSTHSEEVAWTSNI